MFTIVHIATGQAWLEGVEGLESGDPVLFDTWEQAVAWADEHIDPQQARDWVVTSTDDI